MAVYQDYDCEECEDGRVLIREGIPGVQAPVYEPCGLCHGTGIKPCADCGEPAPLTLDNDLHAYVCQECEEAYDA